MRSPYRPTAIPSYRPSCHPATAELPLDQVAIGQRVLQVVEGGVDEVFTVAGRSVCPRRRAHAAPGTERGSGRDLVVTTGAVESRTSHAVPPRRLHKYAGNMCRNKEN